MAANSESTEPTEHERELFAAILAHDTARASAALAAGADPGTIDPTDGYSALSAAVEIGDLPMIRLLVAAGAKPERGILCELAHAIENGWDEVAIELVRAGADPNVLNEEDADETMVTPLMLAARAGRWNVIDALLAAGADPKRANAQGDTAVVLAGRGRHAGALKRLLPFATLLDREKIYDPKGYAQRQAHPDPLAQLREAATAGDLSTVKRLLEQGVDINGLAGPAADTALAEAVRAERHDVMEYLLAAGAELNARSLNPPICWAAMRGNEGLVRDFLARGALVDGPPGSISTALASAAMQGYAAIAKLLVDAGANANAVDSDGVSVLLRAQDFEIRRKQPNPVIPVILAAGAKERPERTTRK
jgi:ankyrin repeat protein